MRIAIGCDDTGFLLKEHVSAALEAHGHDLLDLGTFSPDPVDYPDYARAVGQALLRGFVDAGMFICGSGASAAIAANKIRGIRASLCHDPEAARLARVEDDANVLCLGARDVAPAHAVAIAMAWLGASFSGEERFARRVSKIALLEGGLPNAEKVPSRPNAVPNSPAVPPAQTASAAPASPAPAALATVPPAPVAPTLPAPAPLAPAPPAPAPSAPAPPAPATVPPAPVAPALPAPAPLAPAPPASAPPAPAPASPTPAAVPSTPVVPAPPAPALPASVPAPPATVVARVPTASPVTHVPAPALPAVSRPAAAPMPVEPPVRPLSEVRATTMVAEQYADGMIRSDADYAATTVPPSPRSVDQIDKLPAVQETMDTLEAQDFLDRLWVKDATLWKGEVPSIRHRLGWLTSPTIMRGHIED